MQETQIQFLGWEDPLEKEMAGKSHDQRSLVDYSPSCHKSWTGLSDSTTTTTNI